jgi:tRNA threonylcarbamoyl adenosine modification protein YeaZ
VWLADNVEVPCEWSNDRKNSSPFFENLNAITKKFGGPDTIIVGLGPGSYPGTRIAISAAIGLQLSSGARLTGLPSICAIQCDAREYCAIGDARRKSFFVARIRGHELVEGPMLFSQSELQAKLESLEPGIPIFSSESLPQFERAVIRYPSALVLARLAREPHRSFSLPPLEPIYLREPHITMPKLRIEA